MKSGIHIVGTLVLLTSLFLVSSLEALICTIEVLQLPNDNRCIILYDKDQGRDPRDSDQLYTVRESLKRRGKTSDRKLHVLMPLVLDRVRWWDGRNVLRSLIQEVRAVNVDEELIKVTDMEDIEVCKLHPAIVDLLSSSYSGINNEEVELYFDGKLFCSRKDIVFNDVLLEFEKQKKLALRTYDKMLEVVNDEEVIGVISKAYDEAITTATQGIDYYQKFLNCFGIEASSQEGMYRITTSWSKRALNKFAYILDGIFNPFFDFHAFGRIVSLCHEKSSQDILLIAPYHRCHEVSSSLFHSSLSGNQALYSDYLTEGEGTRLDKIYAVLQEHTPAYEDVYCILL